ncbi:hypothetical protein GCM10023067_60210 [Aminobacter aganoensis]|uniref:hypothetical protein n=1 Tax=Aminobacter aganoensis TaxID=83264 RepID=UPI0031E92803
MTFGSGLRRRSIITTSVSAFIPKDRDKLSWLLAGCSRRQCGMQADDEAEEEKSKQRPDHRGLFSSGECGSAIAESGRLTGTEDSEVRFANGIGRYARAAYENSDACHTSA